MPRTHAGYRSVRWHVVRFLIDLQDPAPPGTVGYVRILPRQAYWLQWTLPVLSPVACGSATGASSPLRVDKCFSVLGLT